MIHAGGGREALRVWKRYAGDIKLVIIDVVMPEMRGKQLADRLKRRGIDAPVLSTSGYTVDILRHCGVRHDDVPFIAKPFSAVQLLCKVRELRDHSDAPARALSG